MKATQPPQWAEYHIGTKRIPNASLPMSDTTTDGFVLSQTNSAGGEFSGIYTDNTSTRKNHAAKITP